MSTPSPKQINGPFADTEVSIYCDESRHELARRFLGVYSHF